MKKEPPKHHITILHPPSQNKDKKDNGPKTEYGIRNKINKRKHLYQK